MGTNCLIWCGVVLLVAYDQRSSFMTKGHLSPVGVRLSFVRGSSVLRPRLLCPSSAASYAPCILILWEFRFPHLAFWLLQGNRLSIFHGSLRPLYLNSLGVLLPILCIESDFVSIKQIKAANKILVLEVLTSDFWASRNTLITVIISLVSYGH